MKSKLNRNKQDEPPILEPRELKGCLRVPSGAQLTALRLEFSPP